jgi:aspartate carbamoyltransferase catalytic subunit
MTSAQAKRAAPLSTIGGTVPASTPPEARSTPQTPPSGPAADGPQDARDPGTGWSHRHLLGLQELTPEQIRVALRTARSFADVSTRSIKKVPALRGKVVANLFFEESTRTRVSFTLAAQRLSADVVDLGSSSSVSKGETIEDTAHNIEAMGVDALVVRHKLSGAAALIARTVSCAVINAGDGRHEHPTQGLLDAYTLAEASGRLDSLDFSGLRVAIVGDIANSRVARSNVAALSALGAEVVCIGPPTLAPRSLEALAPGQVRVEWDLDAALPSVDAVNMLRIQFERHVVDPAEAKSPGATAKSSPAFPSIREYVRMYGLTAERAAKMRPHAIVMHPGPINRGVELAGDVADGPRSVILKQVANGLSVRMAALFLCVAAG